MIWLTAGLGATAVLSIVTLVLLLRAGRQLRARQASLRRELVTLKSDFQQQEIFVRNLDERFVEVRQGIEEVREFVQALPSPDKLESGGSTDQADHMRKIERLLETLIVRRETGQPL